MADNPLYDEYIRKRRAYHAAGKAARGTEENSGERQRYALAKSEYQAAGRALAVSRKRANVT